ncbi:lipopolysaccharide-induced tumor necrosis factor-alpha factor homolog [Bombina bombina]|uniref:lipopolysaccharide-induced tumor necrosis factor-alpha factor homolog n=1 Tax=Bombina bombina TaxID=8345 RepID=UPI00235A5E71|nr:lipopolysaccharide-induced tumor necrosis factor-alpha factor homolog [Bombina bombina]
MNPQSQYPQKGAYGEPGGLPPAQQYLPPTGGIIHQGPSAPHPYAPGYQQNLASTPDSSAGTGPARGNVISHININVDRQQPAPQPQQVITSPPPSVGPYFTASESYRDIPVTTVCKFCQQQVVTRIEFVSGLLAWLICFTLIIFGFVLGCCLIPFYFDVCKDVRHYCPRCNQLIHVYKRM